MYEKENPPSAFIHLGDSFELHPGNRYESDE